MASACVAIVDPYSSGAILADALVARGATCVAIESSPRLPASMKSHFDAGRFREVIQHTEDLDATIQALSHHAPTHVIAGFESGVELADHLSDQLGLPGNLPTNRESRRDKFSMTEAVRRHGLRTALQFQSRDVDELLDWTRANLEWPVIVKPPKSVASDHVRRCRNADELRAAAASVLSDVNVLGMRNTNVLVQEFLDGPEYIVDTVSLDAHPKLTAIWQYHRPVGTEDFICYNAMQLLPYDGERQEALRAYVFEVLRALGIRFGPAHSELIWVSDQPVMVEVGARMSAGVNAVLSRVCGGICQLDETVDVLLDPDRFRETFDQRPRLEQFAVNVFLMPRQPGTLVRTHHVEELRRLPTLHSMSLTTQAGELLQRVAGRITLVHPDAQAIESDITTIRGIERAGIFEVIPISGA